MQKPIVEHLNSEILEEKANKICLKIEHVLSGKVFSYGEEFNIMDTIGEMKKKVIKSLESNTEKVLCDFHQQLRGVPETKMERAGSPPPPAGCVGPAPC